MTISSCLLRTLLYEADNGMKDTQAELYSTKGKTLPSWRSFAIPLTVTILLHIRQDIISSKQLTVTSADHTEQRAVSDGGDHAQVQVSSDLGVAEVVEATTLKVFLNHHGTN